MSAQNVELVLALQPRPEVDLATTFRQDAAWAAMSAGLEPFLAPGAVCIPRGYPGNDGVILEGLEGLRPVFLEWLDPWESYRTEIEDAIDLGDRVLVLVRDYGRRSQDAHEVALSSGAVWTVDGGKVTRIEFCAS